MKIIQLSAENVKKIKAIDITPTKDFISITGKNGSGKTSVLDSIWWALAGKDAIQDKPIRDGELKATVRLNLGEIVVERKFTDKGTTLAVCNADGAKYPSPQAVLDDIIGTLAFDPLDFSRMKPKQQFDMLRQVAKIDLDFEDLAAKDKADYEARRDVNRDIKQLEAQHASIPIANAPAEPVNVAALMQELDEIGVHNRRCNELAADRKLRQERASEIIAQIDTLKAELEKITMGSFIGEIPPKKDDSEVRDKISGAQQANAAFEAAKNRKELADRIKTLSGASDGYTRAMEAREAARQKALMQSAMPVPNITLGHDAVFLNGIPFEQASAAEQLRASVAIAMAANPKLRIIRITDGSLLDDDGLKMIEEMARGGDYQVWCERVDSSGKIGIYMEDGAIAAVN